MSHGGPELLPIPQMSWNWCEVILGVLVTPLGLSQAPWRDEALWKPVALCCCLSRQPVLPEAEGSVVQRHSPDFLVTEAQAVARVCP